MDWLKDAFVAFLRQNEMVTIVILAVLVVRMSVRGLPRKYAYLLWGIVGIRMLFNIRISAIFSLFNLLPDRSGALARVEDAAWSGAVPLTDAAVGGSGDDAVPAGGIGSGGNGMDVTLMHILAVVWIAGILLMLLYGVFSYIRCRKIVRYAVRMEGNIWECNPLPSPFVLGIWRPRIFIPFHMSAREQAFILAHERYHIHRRDTVVKPLGFLLLAVYWFNPFVWLSYYLMTQDMEMSCDEAVLQRLGEDVRKEYGALMLSFAVGKRGASFVPLAFGESDSFKRIRHVLDFKKPAVWKTAAGILLLALTALLCLTNRRTPAGEEQYTLRPELLKYRDITYEAYRELTGEDMEFYHGGFYSGHLPDTGAELVMRGEYDEAMGGYRLNEASRGVRLQGCLSDMLVMDDEELTAELFVERLAEGGGAAPDYMYSDGAGTAYYVDDYYISIRFDSDRDGKNDALLEIALGSKTRTENVGADSAAWLYLSLPESEDDTNTAVETFPSEPESVDSSAVEPAVSDTEVPTWLLPNMSVAQGEHSLKYTMEGMEEEEPAWLVYGDGYAILIPKEGYTMYAPDAWKSEKNDTVQLWITHFSEDMPTVRALLGEQGYEESPYDGMTAFYKHADGVITEVQFFRNDASGIWGVFYSYPDVPEMVEGFKTRLRTMAWSTQDFVFFQY